MTPYDTIIIGAGMSGLAAGIRLAHFDQRVCIVERHTKAGGLNSFYHRNGRNFDVGLHAVTNFAPRGSKQGPLAKVLRQLRLAWDDFALFPQIRSTIAFPGIAMRFSNDLGLLRSEVARHFPKQKDRFERLLTSIAYFEELGQPATQGSARSVVGDLIDDPLLVEMLFCPVLFYGGCREQDLEFGQFSVLFRSIFFEGLARPAAGIRTVLNALVGRFQELGGELRFGSGVRRIVARGDTAEQVVLDDGSELAARRILSSAGWRETLRLCGQLPPDVPPPGAISFVESISILNTQPRALGLDQTTVFFNDSPKFEFRRPEDAVDLHSSVVCSPNNFAYEEPLEEGIVRITALANYDRWAAMEPEDYQREKLRCGETMAASAVRFVPDFRGAVIDHDLFTPTTLRRFTGHENGAVYGAPRKRYDGATPLKNLFLCGTDQGLVGIVGAIVSGITVANRHCLQP